MFNAENFEEFINDTNFPMEFRKYQSLEQEYNRKVLNKYIDTYGNVDVAVFEKVHGANFSIWYHPTGGIRFAKRTSFLNWNEGFFDYQKVVKETGIMTQIQKALEVLGAVDVPVIFTGELFGVGVQKEVVYNRPNGKDIVIFDIWVEGKGYAPANILEMLNKKGLSIFAAPMLYTTFEIALDLDPEFLTPYNPVEGNFAEGYVIRGAFTDYTQYGSHRLIVKKKHPLFREKAAKEPKKERTAKEEDVWADTFKSYVNENRVRSAISKLGEFDDIKKMGGYIKEIIEDAKREFLEDFEGELEGLNLKYIFNVGAHVAKLLRNELQG